MLADPDEDRRGEHVALVLGEVDADPIGILRREGGVHRLEVGEPARGEAVALGGLDVGAVEGRQVGRVSDADLDAVLRGLLDVAAPRLVHAGEHVGLGAARERHLEDVLRLAGREAVVGAEVPEAQPPEARRRRPCPPARRRRASRRRSDGRPGRRWLP